MPIDNRVSRHYETAVTAHHFPPPDDATMRADLRDNQRRVAQEQADRQRQRSLGQMSTDLRRSLDPPQSAHAGEIGRQNLGRVTNEAARRAAEQAAQLGRMSVQQVAEAARRGATQALNAADRRSEQSRGQQVPTWDNRLPEPDFTSVRIVGELDERLHDWATRLWFLATGLPDGVPARVRATQWVELLREDSPRLGKQPGRPVDRDLAARMAAWEREGSNIRGEVLGALATREQQNLSDAMAEIQRLHGELITLEGRLRELIRLAFLSGDESVIASTVDVATVVMDTLLSFDETTRTSVSRFLEFYGRRDVVAPSQLVHCLDRVSQAYAMLSLALIAMDDHAGDARLDQAADTLTDVVAGFGALETLIGLEPHVSLLVNMHVTPQLAHALAGIRELRDEFRLEKVQWNQEFGQDVCDDAETASHAVLKEWMAQVMLAEDPDGAPMPPGDVTQFLSEHAAALDAGTQTKLPHAGALWWRHVDSGGLGEWAVRNRNLLWVLLYGDEPPPR